MDIETAIYGRHAVRDYTDAPVPDNLVERLLQAAVQAPSAVNAQPWSFVVVQGRELLGQLDARLKTFLLDTMPVDGPAASFRPIITNPKYRVFHAAPALIIICARTGEPYVTEDCALAAQNLMLMAHSIGLGTCWIGLARDWLALPGVKHELGIPADHLPVAPIIIGTPTGAVVGHGREAPRIVAWRRSASAPAAKSTSREA